MDESRAAVTPQELKNEFVRFTLHPRPACVVEFNVEALEPLVTRAHKQAVKAVAKEVTLPGFRKGEAPEARVAKDYPQEVDKQWQQAIADHTLQECQQLAKLPFLRRGGKITYQMKSHSSKGALLQLFAEVEPTLPHVDPKKMHLKPVKRPEVNEKKVEETMRQTQLFFATWHPVTERGVQDGDFISLDVEVIETLPPEPLFSKTRFEVTTGSMAQWMYDLVVGARTGAVLEGVSKPDVDASEEEKTTLPEKKVRLTLHEINTATLPEMTDAFVAQLGVTSVDEMRKRVTQLLNTQADTQVLEEQRKQVNDFLTQEHPFELPVTLIEKETEFRFRQLWNEVDFQTYWKGLTQEARTKMIQTVREQSEKAVRLFYLCRQILADAQIPITSSDVNNTEPKPLDLLMQPSDQMKKTPEIEQAEAYSRLVLEKAGDFIIRNAASV